MMNVRFRPQRGEGKIGCIFWTALLIFFAYVAWQVVPVKMRSIDFDQFLVRQAEAASVQSRAERRLKANVMAYADELRLPLAEDDLVVKRTGARIRVTATYTVQIKLFVTTYDWVITHDIERRMMRV